MEPYTHFTGNNSSSNEEITRLTKTSLSLVDLTLEQQEPQNKEEPIVSPTTPQDTQDDSTLQDADYVDFY